MRAAKALLSLHPHTDMILDILGSPCDDGARIREKKGEILNALGFAKGDIFHELSFVPVQNDKSVSELFSKIESEVRNGNNVLLIGYDISAWDSNVGGHPVATIASVEEMESRLVVCNGRLKGVKTQRGELLPMDEPVIIFACSRKSRCSRFSGFGNSTVSRCVRLGGGFRLQVDDIHAEGGTLKLVLSGSFCFDDAHQRVLAFSSDDDVATPYYRGEYAVEYTRGALRVCDPSGMSVEDAIACRDIGAYSRLVFEQIFAQDQTAITSLLRLLLSVRPSLGVHQLEGFFSLQGDKVRTAVIDFDGIDNLDTLRARAGDDLLPPFTPTEQILSAHLALTDFLLSDPGCLRDMYIMRRDIDRLLTSLADSELSAAIQDAIRDHISWGREVFERAQTGPIKLARVLKTLDVGFAPGDLPGLRTFTKGRDTLVLFDICGFAVAFWERDGTLIDSTDVRKLSRELGVVTGSQIVPAHLNYLGEGD